MKKKILITTIFSIFLLIGGFLFINNSFKKENIETRKYILVKVKDGKYPFPLTFKKYITVKEVLLIFDIPAFSQIKKIESSFGKKKKELNWDDKLTYDTNIKVIYKTK